MSYPFPKGVPLSVPLPQHGTLNYASSEASSIAASSQRVSSGHQNMPEGQQIWNGDPLCNVCEEILEPLFAQTCGLCKLHYHISCGERFEIGGTFYFELCRTCTEKCYRVKTKLYEEIRAAGVEWNEEVWVHVIARNQRRGRGMERPPYKHMHKLQK